MNGLWIYGYMEVWIYGCIDVCMHEGMFARTYVSTWEDQGKIMSFLNYINRSLEYTGYISFGCRDCLVPALGKPCTLTWLIIRLHLAALKASREPDEVLKFRIRV